MFFLILCLGFLWSQWYCSPNPEPCDVSFVFKKREYAFAYPILPRHSGPFWPHVSANHSRLDTMSNYYDEDRSYVEIIRQDDAERPRMGLALGFEFEHKYAEYPYEPAHAVIQFKSYQWGGLEFSPADTFNYTGVNNAVSADIKVLVDGFRNDTLWGRFSGALIDGAGHLEELAEGRFCAKVYHIVRF